MKIAIFLVMLPFILPIILFILFIFWLINKSKKESWSGVVINKNYNQKKDFDNPHKIEHLYSLVIEVPNQRTRNFAVSQQDYEFYNVGDKVIKKKGKLRLEKIS